MHVCQLWILVRCVGSKDSGCIPAGRWGRLADRRLCHDGYATPGPPRGRLRRRLRTRHRLGRHSGSRDSAPGEHTPNGTPLPRGPPPPHTVQRDRPLSHAVSLAVQNALQREGVPVTRALTLVMGGAATLTSVRIELRHLTDATTDHPNVLLFNDSNNEDDSGEEHRDRTGERDGHHHLHHGRRGA